MRVMVAGATTPLGAAIVEHLLSACDVELVLAVGREREPATRHAGDRLAYRAVDLVRARPLHDLLWGEARELGVATVVHAMHHRRAFDRGDAVHAQNVDAARELVVACADHPTIRRIVYRSFAEVYAPRRAIPDLIDEDAPLAFDPAAPQWVRDRVEADLLVCSHLGGALEIAVLRCADILAADVGSQLWDYLSSRACLRPLGFDPMLNVLSLDDAAAAFGAACASPAVGVFNIPGYDTLPLSRAIAESAKLDIAVPKLAVARRFHFGGVLDGRRALAALDYAPKTPVVWPRPWWRRLVEQLAEIQEVPS